MTQTKTLQGLDIMKLEWLNPNGDDLTGYQLDDFFEGGLSSATSIEALRAAYKGADCDGIGVRIIVAVADGEIVN